MLSIAVQFEELSITRTASITDEKLGVVMTMKIDAAEVAKVFSDLKLPAAFKAYEQQLGDPGAMKLDFGDRVALILRAELASRTQKRIQRRIKESGICDSMVGLDNTIFTPDRGMDETYVRELARCEWLAAEEPSWILITGKSGTGKTWIMKSLIKAAAERQYRCRYVKTRDLMEDIAIAVDEKRFSRLADQLDRYDLIGLDDFNLLKAKDEVREAMLELFDRRWNKRGLIISSQYPFDQWYEYIGGRGDQRDAMMGAGDQQQASRGSSVLVDNIRWQSYLSSMTSAEAEEWGVDDDQRRFFVRFGVSKANYGAPFADRWFRRHDGGVLKPAVLERQRKSKGVPRGEA